MPFRRPLLMILTVLAITLRGYAAPATPERLKVGALLTLSGKFASAGEDCRQGIEAGLAVAGPSTPIEIAYVDSLNDPSASISAFRQLAFTDHVVAVYTHRSSVGMALNPVSSTTGVPLLGAVAHEDFPRNNEFAYQTCWRTDDEGRFVAQAMAHHNLKKVALLATEDEYTGAVANSFRAEITRLGGAVVFDQALLPAETDFRTVLLQLKNKSVDAVYLDLLLPHIIPVVKQSADLGIHLPIFGNFYLAKEEVLQAVGAAALEGAAISDLDNDLPALKAHLQGGRAENPPGLTVTSYVAALMLSQTAAGHPEARTPAAFAAALAQLREIKTPDRVFQVKDRVVQFPLRLKIFHDGKIVPQ